MTDRELLELAAKAAGMPHQWCEAWKTMAIPFPDGGFLFESVWNPLTDDGDALRLAVKAEIDVIQIGDVTRADYMIGIGFCTVEVPHWGDPYAATRRAIVRAAAEIGRSKT